MFSTGNQKEEHLSCAGKSQAETTSDKVLCLSYWAIELGGKQAILSVTQHSGLKMHS